MRGLRGGEDGKAKGVSAVTGSNLPAAALRTDATVAEGRRRAMYGPDAGSGLAMITLNLCDELIIYRDMALRLERLVHESVKDTEL
jgi:hypothetical protein